MQDSKNLNWVNGRDDATDTDSVENASNGGSPEPDGWQQYRRWISKAPAPNNRRGAVDPSLYTWKGYRNWTEQIKRNWSEKS